MDIGLLGIILSLNNMAKYGGSEWQLNDMSVVMNDVSTLKKTILEYPGFNLEMFKHQGFNRAGKTGIYASNSLRKYLFPELVLPDVKGLVKPNENGILIIFYYEPRTNMNYSNEDDGTLHILALNEDEDPDVLKAFLWHAAQG